MTNEQKQENQKKYGAPDKDVIAQAFALHERAGHSFCGFTAIKYITRFLGSSLKAGNPKDLEKALDFITRMKEVAEAARPDAKNLIQ